MPAATQVPVIGSQSNLGVFPNEILPPIIRRDQNDKMNQIASSSMGNILRNDTGRLHNDSAEWLEIERMLSAGIIPSFQRVKECIVSSCLQNSKADVQEVSKSLCCIADILKLEEESLTPADSDMMELLVSLESCQLAF